MTYNHYIPVKSSTIFLAHNLFLKPVLHFLNESFIDSPKLIIWSEFWNIWTTFDAFPQVKIKKLGWKIYDLFWALY